jgi:hypothetical protein
MRHARCLKASLASFASLRHCLRPRACPTRGCAAQTAAASYAYRAAGTGLRVQQLF